MDTQELLSLYAAAVATLVAVMQIRDYLRNAVRLKVLVTAGRDPSGLGRTGANMVQLRVVNTGRRPVGVKAVGFTLRDGRSVYFDHEDDPESGILPVPLDESEDFRILWVADVLREKGLDKGPAAVVWAEDVAGRRYENRLSREQSEAIAAVFRAPRSAERGQGD